MGIHLTQPPLGAAATGSRELGDGAGANCDSLPLGGMDGAKAPPGRQCGLRRTDGRDKKRIVAETADIMRS